MIIASCAGSGKTTLAKRYPDKCVEVSHMPYTWILPEASEEFVALEEEKNVLYHVNNPLYPYNMVAAVLEAERHSQFVIVLGLKSVVDILRRVYEREIVFCYPEDILTEKCGTKELNGDSSENYHLVLGEQEFLSDKFEEIEQIYKTCPQKPVAYPEEISALYNIIRRKKESLWLEINVGARRFYYNIGDIDDVEEKRFIYDLGKQLYYENKGARIWAYDFDVRRVHPL